MTLVYIPPGRFTMGSPPNEEGRDDDEVQHRVILSRGFLMGATEVTQAQFEAVMGYNPSRFTEDGSNKPVHSMRRGVPLGFCEKLSEQKKIRFRLPTEAEWEYAARAGTRGPYGGTGKLEDMGWVDISGGPRAVAQKRPNAWGLYDMHGNVWELCSDYYTSYPGGGVSVDPEVKERPRRSLCHVGRGGSWWRGMVYGEEVCEHGPAAARSANRWEVDIYRDIGFRVVAEIK
jgi:formylglycine-generating enzyme required for sulfatase activity